MIPRQQLRILCVDDSAPVLTMLGNALRAAGYEVEPAHNGYAALMKLGQNLDRFPLVITDLRMPGMSGVALIEQARASGYTGKFIVYAGSIEPDAYHQLRELRVECVIEKPGRPGELVNAIREAQAGA